MVDFNDRDADGNYNAKEIRIPDFNAERLLSSLPLSEKQNKQELIDGLNNRKRMDVELVSEVKSLKLQVEALPLRRSLQLYEKGDGCPWI